GEAPGARAERRCLEEFEELGGRTLGLSAHAHVRGTRAEVGDADAHIVHSCAEDGATFAGDLHAIAFEYELRVDRLDARPARGVVEQAFTLGGADAERALGRIED